MCTFGVPEKLKANFTTTIHNAHRWIRPTTTVVALRSVSTNWCEVGFHGWGNKSQCVRCWQILRCRMDGEIKAICLRFSFLRWSTMLTSIAKAQGYGLHHFSIPPIQQPRGITNPSNTSHTNKFPRSQIAGNRFNHARVGMDISWPLSVDGRLGKLQIFDCQQY